MKYSEAFGRSPASTFQRFNVLTLQRSPPFPGPFPSDLPGRFYPFSPIPRPARACDAIRMTKAIIWGQLNPEKTMQQLVNDRELYRLLAIGAPLMACFL